MPPVKRAKKWSSQSMMDSRKDIPELIRVLNVVNKKGIEKVPFHVRLILLVHDLIESNINKKIRIALIIFVIWLIFSDLIGMYLPGSKRILVRLLFEATFGTCGICMMLFIVLFLLQWALSKIYDPEHVAKYIVVDCPSCLASEYATKDCEVCFGNGIDVENKI